jgi:ketosteroid isomerase-like protein
MTNICLRLFCVFVFCVAAVQLSIAQSKPDKSRAGFQAFLAKVDTVQIELQNGKAEAFKSVWSRADDVTLSGGFGGTVEKGWTAVAKRLDWVGENFSKGKNTVERLVVNNNEALGYVIQLEHIRFTVPGNEKETTRHYRVTMIFRREKDGWRIVHRQADSNLTKQAPQ